MTNRTHFAFAFAGDYKEKQALLANGRNDIKKNENSFKDRRITRFGKMKETAAAGVNKTRNVLN